MGKSTAKTTILSNIKCGKYVTLIKKISNFNKFADKSSPGLLKIGYTKKLPEERAKQISAATGVAMPYKVEWAYQCFNGETVEREVHHKLKSYRVNNNKEFFQISLDEAKETINLINNKFK